MTRPGLEIRHRPEHRTHAARFQHAWPGSILAVERILGEGPSKTVILEIAGSAAELDGRVRELTGRGVPDWVAGVAIPARNLIIARADLYRFDSIGTGGLLTHELSHIVLHQRLAGRRAARAPRWFDEGVAQVAEGRLFSPHTVELPVRAFFGTLLDFDELEKAFPATEGASALAYAQADSLVRFLRRKEGSQILDDLVALMASGSPIDEALRSRTGRGLAGWEDAWRSELRADRGWVLGVLLQAATFAGLVAAVVLGASRVVQRRNAAARKWEEEEREEAGGELPGDGWDEAAPHDLHHGAPPRRKRRRGWRGERKPENQGF